MRRHTTRVIGFVCVRGHMLTAYDARHAGAASSYTPGPPAGVALAGAASAGAASAGAAPAGAASAGAPLTCAAPAWQTASPAPGGAASTEWTALLLRPLVLPSIHLRKLPKAPLPRPLLAGVGSPFQREHPRPSQCSIPL